MGFSQSCLTSPAVPYCRPAQSATDDLFTIAYSMISRLDVQ
jgi:hypothetical protein